MIYYVVCYIFAVLYLKRDYCKINRLVKPTVSVYNQANTVHLQRTTRKRRCAAVKGKMI